MRNPSSLPSIAQRVARAFPATACVAGFKAFAGGRVELSHTSASAVHAVVKSKRTRRVHLEARARARARASGLTASCTCPTGRAAVACQHIWATLLAVDRHGALTALRDVAGPLTLEPRPRASDGDGDAPIRPPRKRGGRGSSVAPKAANPP